MREVGTTRLLTWMFKTTARFYLHLAARASCSFRSRSSAHHLNRTASALLFALSPCLATQWLPLNLLDCRRFPETPSAIGTRLARGSLCLSCAAAVVDTPFHLRPRLKGNVNCANLLFIYVCSWKLPAAATKSKLAARTPKPRGAPLRRSREMAFGSEWWTAKATKRSTATCAIIEGLLQSNVIKEPSAQQRAI